MTDRHRNKPALKKRTPNPAPINMMVQEYLVSLTRRGVYGNTPNEVSRTLLYDAIKQKIDSGELRPIEFDPERHGEESGGGPDED